MEPSILQSGDTEYSRTYSNIFDSSITIILLYYGEATGVTIGAGTA